MEAQCPHPQPVCFHTSSKNMTSIDLPLTKSFSPERIAKAYFDYKESKRDRFRQKDDDDKYSIAMGVDGVSYQAFEKQLSRHAANISSRIRDDRYFFQPFREIKVEKSPAKDNLPAKYRTLSIACIRDVLVQNILYADVLYEPCESLFCELDHGTPVSFAYRKGKSAPDAALVVNRYLHQGYRWVFDADLSSYFDTIPHSQLLKKVASLIGGEDSITYRLINRFVHVDRVPYETYKSSRRKGRPVGHKIYQWKKPIRIRREAGVPQGGVLSGMLANLYLHEFDVWVCETLASGLDIQYVRYADDFIILAKSECVLHNIHEAVKQKLCDLSLKLNEDKTRCIDAYSEGLEFLGFGFDGSLLGISTKNINRYKARIESILQKAIDDALSFPEQHDTSAKHLKWLSWRIRYKVKGFSGQTRCPICDCDRVGSPRSWIAFFQRVNDIDQIRQLDRWTRAVVTEHVYEQYGVRLSRKYLRQIHFPNLVNELYRVRSTYLLPCVCDVREYGISRFARGLFLRKRFFTLAAKKEFGIDNVSGDALRIFVNGAPCEISVSLLESLARKLYSGEKVVRSELEHEGIRNSSQVVALLAVLPGISYTIAPITLEAKLP